MNIIGNNCCGGFIYQQVIQSEYKNPFIWSLIDDNSFLYLIENYNNINFFNYKIIKNEKCKDTFSLIIEENIKVQYIHYVYDKNVKEPKKIGMNLYYNKIIEKIQNEYEIRVKRMIESKEKPIFVFCGVKEARSSNFYKRLKSISQKYKFIIFTNQTIDVLKTTDNFIVYKTNTKEPSIIIKGYKNELTKILIG